MTLAEELGDLPHLASPAALARADIGKKFLYPPHLQLINRELMVAWATPNSRLIINLPYQHGKSWALTYFAAWALLMWPETRIVLISANKSLADKTGNKVKDVIEKFGREVGVQLRPDSKAKGEWVIEGHEGGMLSRGVGAAIVGRPSDLLLLDDLLPKAKMALSAARLEDHWQWYQTEPYSRLGPTAPIICVGTRWVRNDIFGRIIREEENEEDPNLKEGWKVIKLKALAEAGDPLGRKSGEPLWPARVPLARLLKIQKERTRWFQAGWQQEPQEDKGLWFQPYDADGKLVWPVYKDLGDAYSLDVRGQRRRIYLYRECVRIVTMDWAWGKKKTSDFTSPGAYAVTPSGDLLTLEVMNERWRPEELAPELEKFCIKWAPFLVAVEVGHPTLAQDYRRYRGIPEIRWLTTRGANKLARALQGITMSQNGRVYLPDPQPPWVRPFLAQLSAFTGDEQSGEHDDMVDQLNYACILATEMRGVSNRDAWEPEVLIPGKEPW